MDRANFLGEWSYWLRWIVAIPFSILGYALLYWFIRIFRSDLGQNTFMGSVLVSVGSAIIPIYLLYGIVPNYKNFLTISLLLSTFFIRISGLIIDLIDFSYGKIYFRDVFIETLPNVLSIICIIIFIKIIINSVRVR